ncbi:MAG: hypothetical protein AB1921_04345 [Thermodesulfobacteriota bacterium]
MLRPKTRIPAVLAFFLAAVFLVAALSGCGAKNKAKALLKINELKKMVLLVPPAMENQNTCGESFSGVFKATLSSGAKGVVFVTDPTLAGIFSFDPASITGPAPGQALLAQARAGGFNAICLGRFSGPFITQKKTGLYGFRKVRKVGEVLCSLWIYDTLTGAKILDLSLSRETVLDETWPGQALEVLACPEDVLTDLAEDAADQAFEALSELPWSCQVLSVDGETVTLSAGADAGLTTYITLNVHSRGEEMPGKKGRVYLVPGAKSATVRVTSVSEKTATAQLLSGNPVNPGDWVFLKK